MSWAQQAMGVRLLVGSQAALTEGGLPPFWIEVVLI